METQVWAFLATVIAIIGLAIIYLIKTIFMEPMVGDQSPKYKPF